MNLLWICDYPPKPSIHSFFAYYTIKKISRDSFIHIVTDSLCHLTDSTFSFERVENVEIHSYDPSWGGCKDISQVWAYRKCEELMPKCDGIIGLGRDYKALVPRMFEKWCIISLGEPILIGKNIFRISFGRDNGIFPGAPSLLRPVKEGIVVFGAHAPKNYMNKIKKIDKIEKVYTEKNFPSPWEIEKYTHTIFLPTTYTSFRYLNIFLVLLFASSGVNVAAYAGSLPHWAYRIYKDYYRDVKDVRGLKRWMKTYVEPNDYLNSQFNMMLSSLREFYTNLF